MKWFPLFK